MFSDNVLEKIFSNSETQNIPIGYLSTMIGVVEKVLEEEDANKFQPIPIRDGGEVSFL